MKSLLITLLFVFIQFFSFSQSIIDEVFPTEDGKIKYQEVVYCSDSLSADQMFLNAKKWLVDAFQSGKDVIQTEDQEGHLIIGKGFIAKGHNAMVVNPKNWFTIKLEFKSDRFRYTIYDVTYTGTVSFMGARVDINSPLEEWANQPVKTKNAKKAEKIHAAMVGYLSGLDAQFRSVTESLKSEINKHPDNW